MITVRRSREPGTDKAYRYYLEVGESASMDKFVADKYPEAEEALAEELLARAARRIQVGRQTGDVRLVRN